MTSYATKLIALPLSITTLTALSTTITRVKFLSMFPFFFLFFICIEEATNDKSGIIRLQRVFPQYELLVDIVACETVKAYAQHGRLPSVLLDCCCNDSYFPRCLVSNLLHNEINHVAYLPSVCICLVTPEIEGYINPPLGLLASE